MTPDPNDLVRRISVADARGLVDAARAVLVDARDRRLYDNAHATGAISLPVSDIEAANGQIAAGSVPPDRILIFYCA